MLNLITFQSKYITIYDHYSNIYTHTIYKDDILYLFLITYLSVIQCVYTERNSWLQ